MFYVSDPVSTPPEKCESALRRRAYEVLDELGIAYERVDTDEAVSMDLCALIDKKLGAQIVKTLLVCDRKQTKFYMFITTGSKAFRSHDFSAALGISRVSFAPSEKLEQLLGVKIGATTVLSMLLPSAKDVQVVFDRDVLADDVYACSDGIAAGFVKFAVRDLLYKFLPHTGHEYAVIDF